MAKKKAKPVILIVNDDGVTAPGILNLVDAVKDLGKIVVVAPDKPQSGNGTCHHNRITAAIA
jgi:5'-nucleotidase